MRRIRIIRPIDSFLSRFQDLRLPIRVSLRPLLSSCFVSLPNLNFDNFLRKLSLSGKIKE